jgi:hypothetical protein
VIELVERRVLGAVRFVDAGTALPIRAPLVVEAPGVRWLRNRAGAWVIAAAPGLEAHADAFATPPAEPPVESVAVELSIDDPARRYLARRRTVRLPRDGQPGNAEAAGSLFRAVDVAMFRAPAAAAPPGWAAVRAVVTATPAAVPLRGALLRVVRASDGVRLASGLTDPRGEALVPVPGIPLTTFEDGPGPVLATAVEVRIEVIVDPDAPRVPDPDDLEARRDALRAEVATATLSGGRTVAVALQVTVP